MMLLSVSDRKELTMGIKATEALDLTFDDLTQYLHANHSAYMEVDGRTFYLTDANDKYWRAQDTDTFNEKSHYVDVSELVPTLSEFLELPFMDGEGIKSVFDRAVFYASEKPE